MDPDAVLPFIHDAHGSHAVLRVHCRSSISAPSAKETTLDGATQAVRAIDTCDSGEIGSLTFEHWVQSEREDLHRAYCRALRRLAEAAEARTDLDRAVEWLRRLGAEEPYSARVTVHFMEALEASGDSSS